MGHDNYPAKVVLAELRQVWRLSSGFFLSIELWLVVLSACASVAGVWLAFMGDLRCLLAFGLTIGYLAARIVLHMRQRLSWPFM